MYLGIEIGGSKLQLGVGPDDGILRGLWRDTVDVAAGPQGIRRQIVAAVPELLAKAGIERGDLRGVGIGFGGPVDDATHTVIKSHQIEGWDNFPLANWISELVGLPAVLGNDADVAGLAEALHGAGKGLSPIFYITLGSGIGGGFIINGEIYRGCGRGAAEIGHLQFQTYWLKDPQQVLGSPETLEQLASGWGIGQTAKRCLISEQPVHSSLYPLMQKRHRPLTAKDVAVAARQGDAFAESLLKTIIGFLADAICHVIALLCPRRIIIGGGVSLMGEKLLFEPLRRMVAERVFKPFAGLTDIVPAALGEEVVVHGAIALARQRLAGKNGPTVKILYREGGPMSTATTTKKLMTAEEFYDWVHQPEQADKWFELVRGEVIELPPPFKPHGVLCYNIGRILGNFIFERGKGYITGNDSGVLLERDPDTVRGPDVAYYEDAQTFDELHPKYGEVPPRLAVEVLSPNDRANKVLRKINDYLRCGVGLVWVIDPEIRTVTVHQPGKPQIELTESQDLTGEDVLPGFRCRVADFFSLPGDRAKQAQPPA